MFLLRGGNFTQQNLFHQVSDELEIWPNMMLLKRGTYIGNWHWCTLYKIKSHTIVICIQYLPNLVTWMSCKTFHRWRLSPPTPTHPSTQPSILGLIKAMCNIEALFNCTKTAQVSILLLAKIECCHNKSHSRQSCMIPCKYFVKPKFCLHVSAHHQVNAKGQSDNPPCREQRCFNCLTVGR